MPLLVKPPTGFPLALEPDLERAALEELAQELAHSWVVEIQEAFPDGRTGLSVPLKPNERLSRYLNMTEEGDIDLFMQPNYVENARAELSPLPASDYWYRLVTELPKAAEQNIQDFLKLLRESDVQV